MTLNRRQALIASCATLTTMGTQAQKAGNDYPQKQISFVVSYAAGGNVDLRARMLGTAVSRMLGVPVIVENKPGANGNIGHEFVAKAQPDGHTLVLATMGPMAVSSFVYPKLGFDPEDSFMPIVTIEKAPMVLVTRTDKPFQALKEVVDFGQKNPDKLAFGNAGTGSAHHLSAELFMQSAGIKGLSIPYKGGSQAATALLAGDIDLMFEQTYAALPSIATGKVRPLAVTSEKRLPSLPNVPTMGELGYPKVVVHNWMGMAAPKGTPAAVLNRLQKEIATAMATPDMKAFAEGMGADPRQVNAEAFARVLKESSEAWGKVAANAAFERQ